ncbi:MAG TPA: hypothetical protein VMJ65_01995 [Solirubrobacteraceae bacterium]|nr:hypothetical protein [Solirubrobacteraceae bacterium]
MSSRPCGDGCSTRSTGSSAVAPTAAEGRDLAGPRWEIYGHWREDPNELETEIFWLLR